MVLHGLRPEVLGLVVVDLVGGAVGDLREAHPLHVAAGADDPALKPIRHEGREDGEQQAEDERQRQEVVLHDRGPEEEVGGNWKREGDEYPDEQQAGVGEAWTLGEGGPLVDPQQHPLVDAVLQGDACQAEEQRLRHHRLEDRAGDEGLQRRGVLPGAVELGRLPELQHLLALVAGDLRDAAPEAPYPAHRALRPRLEVQQREQGCHERVDQQHPPQVHAEAALAVPLLHVARVYDQHNKRGVQDLRRGHLQRGRRGLGCLR
mmetsp:Transcript_47442/g.135401  ORF Transcript_47442/g.135401 Transcript_47442/m.135401 type:complete len:262 (-) Transcript_47442:911-1696(-)